MYWFIKKWTNLLPAYSTFVSPAATTASPPNPPPHKIAPSSPTQSRQCAFSRSAVQKQLHLQQPIVQLQLWCRHGPASIHPPALVRSQSSWSFAEHWATSLGNFGVHSFFGESSHLSSRNKGQISEIGVRALLFRFIFQTEWFKCLGEILVD